MDVLVNVLQAIITHTTKQEPWPDIFVLVNGDWVKASGATVYEYCCEMAWELTLIFSNKTPFSEFFSLSALDKESANLVSTKFKPINVVSYI